MKAVLGAFFQVAVYHTCILGPISFNHIKAKVPTAKSASNLLNFGPAGREGGSIAASNITQIVHEVSP